MFLVPIPKEIRVGSGKTIYTFIVKFIYSEKATKILRNLPLTFDYSTYSQKLGEDFAIFCGFLRIYELSEFTFIGNSNPLYCVSAHASYKLRKYPHGVLRKLGGAEMTKHQNFTHLLSDMRKIFQP